MQSSQYTFKKEERLKSKKLIDHLFKKGLVLHQYPFKVLYDFTDDQDFKFPAKIAVSVSKKLFKKAVERNHIKRKIREAYRINKSILYSMLVENDQKLFFFVIYTAKQNIEYSEIEKSMKALLYKFHDKINNVKKS